METFNNHYKIVTQEPVDILYDVVLEDDVNIEDITNLSDIILYSDEKDEQISRLEPTTYYIYDKAEREIYNTEDPDKILEEINRLSKELENE